MPPKKRFMVFKSNFGDGDRVGPVETAATDEDILLIHPNGRCALTADGGLAVKMTNDMGEATSRGLIVAGTTASINNAFIRQTNEYDAIGVLYEAGIADGDETWVVVAGMAEVTLDGAHGDAGWGTWIGAGTTDGLASGSIAPNGLGALQANTHFKELGHAVGSGSAGNQVKIILHPL